MRGDALLLRPTLTITQANECFSHGLTRYNFDLKAAKAFTMMLSHGCDAKVADPQGWTALHHACAAGRTEILLPLLEHEHGADAFALNNFGLTAADIMVAPSREVDRLLERRGLPVSPSHALYNFAIAGGTQTVIALAEQAASQLIGAGLEEHAMEARRLMEALQSPNQLRRVRQVEREIEDILLVLNDGDSSTRWWREGATTTLGRLKES